MPWCTAILYFAARNKERLLSTMSCVASPRRSKWGRLGAEDMPAWLSCGRRETCKQQQGKQRSHGQKYSLRRVGSHKGAATLALPPERKGATYLAQNLPITGSTESSVEPGLSICARDTRRRRRQIPNASWLSVLLLAKGISYRRPSVGLGAPNPSERS